MIKNYLSLIVFLVIILATPILANQPYLSFGGGFASFSSTFASGYGVKAQGGLISDSGIGFETTLGYTTASGELKTDPSIKIVPWTLGVTYFGSPSEQISPFIGVFAGLNFLSSTFDSPGIGYGAKAGMLFQLSDNTYIALDATYQSIHDDETEIDIQPLTLSMSVTKLFSPIQRQEQQQKMTKRGRKTHPNKQFNKRKRDGRGRKLRY